jgi:hypothetical protein
MRWNGGESGMNERSIMSANKRSKMLEGIGKENCAWMAAVEIIKKSKFLNKLRI